MAEFKVPGKAHAMAVAISMRTARIWIFTASALSVTPILAAGAAPLVP
ncbi:hypothetical protein [Nonomuraea harbinensis]|uniref:Uncharacterized protein n=1 Tax=Nonomuraea harbinensis TaxID=1286938 RepID=A0ABW1BMR1_9ACTN|nr:hypothetical protein [Nonomuraea harbinensis]